jgi:hypothetical protein
MPIVTQCIAPGCKTITIGPFCLEHEPVAAPRVFTRGRPVLTAERDLQLVAPVAVREPAPVPLAAA